MNRIHLTCAIALAALMAFAAPHPLAQEDPHAACAAPPSYVPADLLERPVKLRQGVGNSHERVTTASPDAQALYDQGLNYLESYVWIEAARSFHQVLRLDPTLAMAHVGLSRVFSGLENPEAARLHLDKARALAPNAGDAERLRIELRARQLDAMDHLDDVARHLAYKKALDEALAGAMEDTTLWLLRANAEESNAAGRGQRGGAASVAFYEQILRLVPDHASAHHYLVHSYENLGRVDLALLHGEVYARQAPAIPHAAHMWGHDLRRVGRVEEAIAQFRKTDSLERAYYEAEKIDPGLDWHHGHNLDLLATCYQHQGKLAMAEKTIREAAALEPYGAYGWFRTKQLPSFLLQRGRFEEAVDAARRLQAAPHPQTRAVAQALAGQALIGLGRTDEARDALEGARRDLEATPLVTPGVIANRKAVEPYVQTLEGEILLATGARDEGRALLVKVQQAMRAIPGPDAWIQTLFGLESIAGAARAAGDWEVAEHTARQMLEHDAAYGGSHFALALALRHKGDDKGASREMAEARRLWAGADPDLAELQHIAAALATTRR
jgi:tetratricopeptide (TPR) repeat protein